MKKFLKIVGMSLVIWSFSLVWPAINGALSPQIVILLVTGLGAIILAYGFGQYFGRNYEIDAVQSFSHSRPTRPTPVVSTIRHHFSRQTSPMPVVSGQNPASRPTRPMPMAR